MKRCIAILSTVVLGIGIMFTGCGKNTAEKKKPADKNDNSEINSDGISNISIRYIGNSCFYITFADGTRIVTDPYDKSYESYFGEYPDISADAVTVSHMHNDHTGITNINGQPESVLQCESADGKVIGDVTIKSYSGKHTADMGENTIFVYEENGYKIVNMGEADEPGSTEVEKELKDADVVLVYAGEYGDVKNVDAFQKMKKLGVHTMIPEHYSMSADNIFYGEPLIDTIIGEVPAEYSVKNMDEYIVKHTDEMQFIAMSHMS